jgi:hypothetical protein
MTDSSFSFFQKLPAEKPGVFAWIFDFGKLSEKGIQCMRFVSFPDV